jgi:hypothetical protein
VFSELGADDKPDIAGRMSRARQFVIAEFVGSAIERLPNFFIFVWWHFFTASGSQR